MCPSTSGAVLPPLDFGAGGTFEASASPGRCGSSSLSMGIQQPGEDTPVSC